MPFAKAGDDVGEPTVLLEVVRQAGQASVWSCGCAGQAS
jgi:hypothetical protein